MQRLTAETLLAFLRKNRGTDDPIEVDTPLFSSGLLDSASMVELMVFLEQETGISVSPADVTLDNFDSIGRILAYAERAAA